jgi:hypothetical protein
MALITYDMAVRHLRQQGVLDTSPEDPDLALKMEQASAMVLLHIKRPGEWDVTTSAEDDPEFAMVQALVLRVLGWLYRFNGDDENAPSIDTILNLETTGILRDRVIA